MRWSLLALVLPGGLILAALYWLSRHRASDVVSADWLAEQHRRDVDRSAEFEGVCWTRPYNVHLDSCGWLNRAKEQARSRVG